MSITYGVIRSSFIDNDGPGTKILDHTLAMDFTYDHDDNDNDDNDGEDNNDNNLRTNRTSLTLAQCLQTTTRNSFHKNENGGSSTGSTSSSNGRPTSKSRVNPFARKTIKDLLSTSLRTRVNKPLEHIVETVSIAISDAFHESYGSSNNTTDGSASETDTEKTGGINVKEIKNLTYSCSDLSFNPMKCTWRGTVSYDCYMMVKPSKTDSSKEKVKKHFSNSFKFLVSCQTVDMSDNDSNNNNTQIPASASTSRHDVNNQEDDIDEDEEWTPAVTQSGTDLSDTPSNGGRNGLNPFRNKSDRMKHYCIDLEAILDGDDDDDNAKVDLDRHSLKIMSQTLEHIGYDISRALYWLDLPSFPEGCRGVTFRSIYQLNAKIKSGSFATVCLGTHRATKKKIAVKCVQRKNLPPSDDVAIHSEVGILGALRHEYICPIIDFFMEDECYYIVMELMEGGDVFDKVGKLESYDESIARDLCYKMLKGISFCHEQNIAHCDLKPKNLLLKTKDDDTGVMLADFGFATTVFAPKSLKKQCGTPYFVAPEILLREPYDQQADMWSVGVIIYCILSGQLPFTGRRHLDLFKAIIAGEFDFDGGWGDVSDDAKDLICKLLVTDPSKRYTAEDALRCKWFRTNDTLLRRNSLFNASSKLKTFNARLKFKSAILMLQSLSRWKLMTKRSVEKRNEEAKAQE